MSTIRHTLDPRFKSYTRKGAIEARPYIEGEPRPFECSISEADLRNGSPKAGDMIARNPDNHDDQWLISADYFAKHYQGE